MSGNHGITLRKSVVSGNHARLVTLSRINDMFATQEYMSLIDASSIDLNSLYVMHFIMIQSKAKVGGHSSVT